MTTKRSYRSLSRAISVTEETDAEVLYKNTAFLQTHVLHLTSGDYYALNKLKLFYSICEKFGINISEFSRKSYATAFRKFSDAITDICLATVVSHNVSNVTILIAFKNKV